MRKTEIRKKFDYTQWQRSLFENETVEDISKAAADFRKRRTL